MNWSNWITIKGYPHGTTKEKVSEVFGRFGPLDNVSFGKSKYAMVKFTNELDAEKTIQYFAGGKRLPDEKGFKIKKTEEVEVEEPHEESPELTIRRSLESAFNNYRTAQLKNNQDCIGFEQLLEIMEKIPYQIATPWMEYGFRQEMKKS